MIKIAKVELQAWLIFILAAGFLFYQYTLFVIPVVMLKSLTEVHSLTGMMLGFLASAYFYSYLLMQIPAAKLIDRYGAALCVSGAVFCCTVGTLLFADSHSLIVTFMGRLLMGAGAAFATTGYMKLISIWFPTRFFPFMATFFGIACMAGAGTVEIPLAWLVEKTSWQLTLYSCAGFGLVLGLLFLFFVKSKHQEEQKQNPKKEHSFTWQKAQHLLKKPANLALILYAGLCMAPLIMFAGLWGVPALMQIQKLSNFESISIVSFSFFGFVVGGLILDPLIKKLDAKWPLLMIGTALALIFLSVIVNVGALPKLGLTILVFGFGLFSSTCLLGNALNKNMNIHSELSTMTAMMNLATPFWVILTEPCLGKLLDKVGFDADGYKMSLNLLGIYLFFALFFGCFLKGTDRKAR